MAGGAVLTTGPGPAPHFRQLGEAPVFVGGGADDLLCRCAGSTLVRGNRPGALLAIGIECAACGAVTVTPGLPKGQELPQGVRVVERNRMAVAEPLVLAPGLVLADRDELARVDRLSAPHALPAAPFEMSAATLAAAAAEYDRLSGGQLDAHRRAVAAADEAAGLGRLPLAWALAQLEDGVGRPGWWCLAKEPDAVAAMILGAFREFPLVWSQHPRFPAMAASVAQSGFSIHALAVFAAARCVAADGNRIGFAQPGSGIGPTPPSGGVGPTPPSGGVGPTPHSGDVGPTPHSGAVGPTPHSGDAPIDGFHIETGPTERLPVVVRRFDRFDWPGGADASPATARAAAIDALIASQARINPRQPGFLVVSVGAARRTIDPAVLAGLDQTMRQRARRHRSLAGVALILPSIQAAERSDQVTFGWSFVPFGNPQYGHGSVRTGESREGLMQAPPLG